MFRDALAQPAALGSPWRMLRRTSAPGLHAARHADIRFEIAGLHALITPRLTATKAIGQEIWTVIAGGETA
jgi:hypothetical protein